MIVTVKTPPKLGTVFEHLSPGDVFGIPSDDRFVGMKIVGPDSGANAIVLRAGASRAPIPAFEWMNFAPTAPVFPYGAELVVRT